MSHCFYDLTHFRGWGRITEIFTIKWSYVELKSRPKKKSRVIWSCASLPFHTPVRLMYIYVQTSPNMHAIQAFSLILVTVWWHSRIRLAGGESRNKKSHTKKRKLTQNFPENSPFGINAKCQLGHFMH